MQRPDTHARLLAIVLAGCALCFGASAQTYKWTDAEGKVHYSDQPPPGNVKQETKMSPGRKPAGAAGAAQATDKAAAGKAKTYQEQDAEFRRRQVEAAEKQAEEKKKAEEAAVQKQNCATARAQLSTYQTGGRITRTNAQGEREFLTDAEIAQGLERARKGVSDWCK